MFKLHTLHYPSTPPSAKTPGQAKKPLISVCMHKYHAPHNVTSRQPQFLTSEHNPTRTLILSLIYLLCSNNLSAKITYFWKTEESLRNGTADGSQGNTGEIEEEG
jgi:hypothetical protein